MPGDPDLIKLYSKKILALAADLPHYAELEHVTARAKKRSPLCGSSVSVELQLCEGRVAAFTQDVKACALGQAAACITAKAIIGCSAMQVRVACAELQAMLTEDGPIPADPFHDLEVLHPAAQFKNRHASILLSLEATTEALELAQKTKNTG
tara:strand:+ start:91 stop:546 length:456 start_codon:yes stop_codon:yes gene_type:complete